MHVRVHVEHHEDRGRRSDPSLMWAVGGAELDRNAGGQEAAGVKCVGAIRRPPVAMVNQPLPVYWCTGLSPYGDSEL